MEKCRAVSVVIPWCNRDELKTTLLCNGPFFSGPSIEVLVVNVGGDSLRLSELIKKSGLPRVRQIDVDLNYFNKSVALNVGISRSTGLSIFTLDADIILITNIFDVIESCVNTRSYLTIEWVYESDIGPSPQSEENGKTVMGGFVTDIVQYHGVVLLLADGRMHRYRTSQMSEFDGRRAAPGLLATLKTHLLAIGGYNSDLRQWGWEDDDLQIRLQHICGLSQIENGIALHLTHGDDRRALDGMDRLLSNQLNFLRCCSNYNQNRFHGTYDRDLSEFESCISETIREQRPPVDRSITAPSGYVPSFSGGVRYCGSENGTLVGKPNDLDWSTRAPSVDQLIIEAVVSQMELNTKTILHIGVGNSHLAALFPNA